MKNALCAAIVGITGLLITPTIASAQRLQRIPWDVIIPQGSIRFVVLQGFNFEAVLDQETSLVWEKEPSPDVRLWRDAQVHCTTLVKGGRGGWRLPTIQELTSLTLIPPGTGDPLPAGHPFVLSGPLDYWSATSSETLNPAGSAWVFSVSDGAIFPKNKIPPVADRSESAWCVRFRQGVDPQ